MARYNPQWDWRDHWRIWRIVIIVVAFFAFAVYQQRRQDEAGWRDTTTSCYFDAKSSIPRTCTW